MPFQHKGQWIPGGPEDLLSELAIKPLQIQFTESPALKTAAVAGIAPAEPVECVHIGGTRREH
jgi:hypothetical protein